MSVVSIYPNESLKKRLEALAKKDGRSLNNFILSVLTKYCANNRR